jgi:hypothetical protein
MPTKTYLWTGGIPLYNLSYTRNLLHINIIPGIHDHFDVYRLVVIEAPPDCQVGNTPKRWHVRARPEVVASSWKPGCHTHFDMTLVSDGPRSSCLHTLDSKTFLVCCQSCLIVIWHRCASGIYPPSSIWHIFQSPCLH